MRKVVKRWQIAKPAPKKFLDSFPEFSPTTLQLLYNRGIRTEREIEQFLNPDWERDLYDPFLMEGMRLAAKRIKKAVAKKEKVTIFGHFDVDGVTSCVLLYLALRKLGLLPSVYIPDRKENYGLSEEVIAELLREKTDLIITVDTGISSAKEVEIAQRSHLDVIVTDHHKVPKSLPNACAVLNPHKKSCKYPFKELAGVGVVFKLIQGLAVLFPSELPAPYLKWLVDIVALGTICDVVPLVSENRLFAKFGLIVLNKTKNLGLRKLCDVAGVPLGNIDTYKTSFIIGPRLNAPGRMDHANASFYLLTARSEREAEELAIQLNVHNKARQQLLEKALKEAKAEIVAKGWDKKKLIILGKETWPAGIIGLMAGRLTDEYSRPTFVLQVGKEESRGSGRSVENFHITEALEAVKEHLIQFGGHKRAAGFSVLTGKIARLKKALIEIAEQRLTKEDITPTLEIDTKIDIRAINWELWEQLEKFEPTGFGNPCPVFLAEKVPVEKIRAVGKNGNHLKLKLDGFDSIFFAASDYAFKIKEGERVDIVFQVQVDEWGQERKLQLKLLDLRQD